MAIKTKEEMFGDGAGFGAMVPVSVTNPAGHGAGNRGIAFGEQVTSAIANRTHYALALNDEDLDARLGVFETDGLDAAYRLGAVATAGGGRIITLDGGAVETQSTLASEYADDISNAHYRANALSDAVRGATGFEFVSDQDPEDIVTGTGWAGFIDRRAVGFQPAGFSSFFTSGEAVTLNPGGAGGSIIRLDTGGRYFYSVSAGPTPPAGNYTELRLGMDLVEISGTASDDGLYIVDALGAAATQVTVRTLNGAVPAFTVDETGTINVMRTPFASIGTEFGGTRSQLRGALMSAPKGGGAALTLVAGGDSTAGDALRVSYQDAQGALASGLQIDEYGRQTFDVLSEDLLYSYSSTVRLERRDGGAYATRVERSGSSGGGGEFAHMVVAADASVRGRWDFSSIIPYLPAGISNFDASIPFDFIAASPTDGRLDLTSASLTADFYNSLVEYGMLVEIISGGTGDTLGYYVLTFNNSGSDYIEVRDLDHGVPSHFPTTGSGTMRVHTCSRLGASEQTLASGVEGMPVSSRSQVTMYNVMVGGAETDSTALVVMTPGNPLGTEDRAAVSVYKQEPGFLPLEIFTVMPGDIGENGYVEAYNYQAHENIFISNSPSSDAEVLYGNVGAPSPRSRTLFVNLSKMISQSHGTSVKWEVEAGTGISAHYLACLVNSGYGYIPINDMLRTGMDITGLRFRVNINGGGTHGTLSERFFCGMYYVAPTFAMSSSASPVVVCSIDDGVTSGWQTIDPGSTIGGGAHTVDLDGRDYYIYFRASVDGAAPADEIHAIELTVDDPGPRNF